jgi:Ras-related protein Rap-2C
LLIYLFIYFFSNYSFYLGTEQFASMRDLYIKNGRGFLVVFSLTSWQSFLDVRTVREQILRVKGTDNVPICLVGNKCDASLQRQVTPDDALALAQEWTCPYVETSAKLSINVNDTFAEIVREINSRMKTKNKNKKKHRSIFSRCCSCCCCSSS